LLHLEREAEIERTKDLLLATDSQNLCLKKSGELERKGLGLRKLIIQDWTTSSFGKNLLTFAKNVPDTDLPASSIQTGDIVGLYNDSLPASESVTGVVLRSDQKTLTVSVDDSLESIDQEATYFIAKLTNDVTFKRLKSAIGNIEAGKNLATLHNFLFGVGDLSVANQTLNPKLMLEDGSGINYLNNNLNTSQKEAIEFSMKQKELAVIHGPPGTGKTTTVVELITQEVKQGSKVLCCAPSNVAVDNLLEKLAKNKIRVIRIGHPARVQVELQKYSLDAMLANSDQKILAQDVKSDMDKVLSKMKKARGKSERFHLGKEMKQLRKELRDREKRAMKETLISAEVVLATLTSSSNVDGALKNLPEAHFDLAVIDECSQALEIACWIGLIQVKKAVLAGDHLQLPPTIMSEPAAQKGLAYTLMERVIKDNPNVVRMLNTQYRMNEPIMKWSSDTFYKAKLVADESVKSRLLADLPGVASNENTQVPLVLIDTTGCDMYELVTEDEQSKANEGEAALVTIYVKQLISSGIDPSEIAVITPYNLQVELIRLQLREKFPALEIRSVDGFQGREKEVVILSLVRSNLEGQVGFLAEPRRLNVAITRAKRHVALIANVETVSHDHTLKGLMEYFESSEASDVRSAMQYEHLIKEIDIARPEGLELTLKDSAKQPGLSASTAQREISKRNASTSFNGAKNKTTNPILSKKTVDEKSGKKPDTELALDKVETVAKRMNANKAGLGKQVAPKESKEEREESIKNAMQAIIDDFVKNPSKKEFHCSADLSTYERMILHDFAENAQLGHASQGEGKQRHLVLSKGGPKKVEAEKENQARGATSTSTSTSSSSKILNKDEAMVLCSSCAKQVPKVNIELHKLRCTVVDVSSIGKSKKKPKKKTKDQADDDGEEDIDKLLASFDKVDNVCNHRGENMKKCKTKIAASFGLGVQCDHCRLRFCMNHGLPEVHGCGDAARKAARQHLVQDGKIFAGSGRPNFKPDAVKKAQMQRKLDKKLDEMQESRAKKPPKKK